MEQTQHVALAEENSAAQYLLVGLDPKRWRELLGHFATRFSAQRITVFLTRDGELGFFIYHGIPMVNIYLEVRP